MPDHKISFNYGVQLIQFPILYKLRMEMSCVPFLNYSINKSAGHKTLVTDGDNCAAEAGRSEF